MVLSHYGTWYFKFSIIRKYLCQLNFKSTTMKHLTMYLAYCISHLQKELVYFLEVFLWFMISRITSSSLLLQLPKQSFCKHTCRSLPLQTYNNVQNLSVFPWKIVSAKLFPCCYNCIFMFQKQLLWDTHIPTSFDKQKILILSSQKSHGSKLH